MGDLSSDIKISKSQLLNYFGENVDFYTKDIKLCGVNCCICIFEGLSSLERLWIMTLDTLSRMQDYPSENANLYEYLMKNTELPLEKAPVDTLESAALRLTSGSSVILIDGSEFGVAVATQNWQFRSVQEPSTEGNLHGSRESFTEPLRINISLVRRMIRTGDLRIETMVIGESTKTEIAIMYSNSMVPKDILSNIKSKLKNTKLPFVFDTGYIAAFMRKSSFSLFQSVGYTERPDTVAAKICEGKIVIMANGSPFALLIPYFFSENFQSMDDYTEKAYFASFIRILKYTAFFLAVMLPGLFVSAISFTPEVLPEQLINRIAATDLSTPLPFFLEALLMNFLLEIIREAGLRMPKPIGQSVSLVAALIVGDAAISVGLVSAPIVIIIALTAICGFVLPSLYEPIISLRILFILMGGLLGHFGILVLTIFMLINICNMEIFSMPYTAPLVPFSKGGLNDGILRAQWRKLNANHNNIWNKKDR